MFMVHALDLKNMTIKPPIKYNLDIKEGYDMFIEAVNSENAIIGVSKNNFFYIKRDKDFNFIVEKNILNIGLVIESSKDVFEAIDKILQII